MVDQSKENLHFNWWPPLCLMTVSWAAFLRLVFFDPVMGSVAYLFVVVPLVSVLLLIYARRRVSRRFYILALIIYLGVSSILIKNSIQIRDRAQWIFGAKAYKAKVLAQHEADGEFKHIEWDGWGFPGAGDTVVYLIFDPEDSLKTPASSKASGKFHGISCPVVGVKRLESHWYTVLFYTDTEWGRCS